MLQGFQNTGFLLLLAAGSMVLLGLLAIPVLVRRKNKVSWQLLAINIALWVGAAFIIPNSMGHYAIYLAPAFLWLVAEYLDLFLSQTMAGQALGLRKPGAGAGRAGG